MAPHLPAGALLAERFVIESAVGEGGMAVVYRALDRISRRPAALKLLHEGTHSPFITEHFAREAEILASLQHPNIVSYIAHGRTSAGQAYLAMEWLAGEDLGQRLRRGPLLLGEALRLLTALADALSTAHRSGVVHRDLKPTTIPPERHRPQTDPQRA
jgi:serine/threonine protein kinase